MKMKPMEVENTISNEKDFGFSSGKTNCWRDRGPIFAIILVCAILTLLFFDNKFDRLDIISVSDKETESQSNTTYGKIDSGIGINTTDAKNEEVKGEEGKEDKGNGKNNDLKVTEEIKIKQKHSCVWDDEENVQNEYENGSFKVIGTHMFHDKTHFTEGLSYANGNLYESIGMNGNSAACRLNPCTGKVKLCVTLEKKYFGEGMQVYGEPGDEKLIQLTYERQVGFIRNADTLEVERTFDFKTKKNEGWGICANTAKNEFIVSDGSSLLYFWDMKSLQETRRVSVKRDDGKAVKRINELEYFKGFVFANIWYSNNIIVIDPENGLVVKEYDLSKLEKNKEAGVLNGISVTDEEGVFYITGKYWDRMYRVKFADF